MVSVMVLIEFFILCTSFSTNPWFRFCFKVLLSTTYFSSSYELYTSSLYSQSFILFGQNRRSLVGNYRGYLTSTPKIYPSLLFLSQIFINVLSKFYSFDSIQSYQQVILKHCLSVQIVLITYDNSLSLLQSLLFYFSLHIDVLHDIIHLLLFFVPFIAYRYQLIILILFLSFLSTLAMLILVLIKLSRTKFIYLKIFGRNVFKHIG